MKWFGRRAPFPLLTKELVEQAARKRTYVVRVLYALLLFACFFLFFYEELSSAARDPASLLGRGRDIFKFLMLLQFAGIFVFLPAMMSGVLTYEKERDSLSLLFLTGLRPWEIILQKYAGRLIPMFTFLLLALPFLAISYALGGISTDYLCSGVFLLLLTCLQVGAFSLMLSAFCTTTSEAFVASYVLGALFYFALPLLCVLFSLLNMRDIDADPDLLFAFVPPYIFSEAARGAFQGVLARSIPVVVSTAVFLLMARGFLVRRAFVKPRGLTLAVFNRLDAFWFRVNRRVGGIVLIKDRHTLPEKAPITWREVNKRSLGKASHLVRVLCILGIPVALVGAGVLFFGFSRPGREADLLSASLFILWPVAVLALAVPTASTFAAERTNMTLDVLLVTPLAGEEIVRQKARGRGRLAFVMAALILLVVMLEAWAESTPFFSTYVLSSLLSVLIYLPMFTWVSLWIGLRARTPGRATIGTLSVIVLWCVLPFVLASIVALLADMEMDRPPLSYLLLLSPASIIAFTETNEWGLFSTAPLHTVLLNYGWYTAIMMCFRQLCIKNSDRDLGRVAEGRPLARDTQ